jgi:glycine cleavage system aminomethyltransferase T
LDMEADFIGKAALQRIRAAGVTRKQVGLRIDCAPLKGPNTTFWPISVRGDVVGRVTSAIYSPRLRQNIALAMVSVAHTAIDTVLDVQTAQGLAQATVVEKPFFDPQKKTATAA